MSALSLMTYAFGLPAFILVKVLAPGFYSRQDTKTPVKIGIISIFANMLLNLLIVLPWYYAGWVGAHAGLALATALAAYVNAGLLFRILYKEGIFAAQGGWLKHLARIALASVVMCGLVWLVSPQAGWWQTATSAGRLSVLAGLIALSVVSYFISLRLTGVSFKQMLGR